MTQEKKLNPGRDGDSHRVFIFAAVSIPPAENEVSDHYWINYVIWWGRLHFSPGDCRLKRLSANAIRSRDIDWSVSFGLGSRNQCPEMWSWLMATGKWRLFAFYFFDSDGTTIGLGRPHARTRTNINIFINNYLPHSSLWHFNIKSTFKKCSIEC